MRVYMIQMWSLQWNVRWCTAALLCYIQLYINNVSILEKKKKIAAKKQMWLNCQLEVVRMVDSGISIAIRVQTVFWCRLLDKNTFSILVSSCVSFYIWWGFFFQYMLFCPGFREVYALSWAFYWLRFITQLREKS